MPDQISGGGQKAAACLALLLLALAAGCSLYGGVMPPSPSGDPLNRVHGVPFYAQEEYQCGPAALAMAMTWSGLPVLPDELTSQVYTPSRKGSIQPDMITAARRRGRMAYVIHGADSLSAEIAEGVPVVVLQNLGLSWYPVWHYAVVVGLDRETGEVILNSGPTRMKRTPWRVFENTWGPDFWGLLVLPPSRLPTVAEEKPWLEGAVGLERAGQPAAAREAYASAAIRWPNSHDAWIGLGNTRYAGGDAKGSAEAFRRAAEARPDSGIAFNNLAFVLNELGRRDEALKAARKAVSLGGPQIETFRRTLSDIERAAP
ncbi:PA2778 family cysteine peptidase [Pseudodesulfovibrio thermohalotolerans]|uniref:PA2778 family cysteine peptidase n=1 Tax=Pseudodesulfovibrio thermohalotolerans TaxID=2880651 RepID=UPI002441CF62|nr:PA2778 family cysteine peptidase [Pseudodesulfovibrio thermohalotolerans]WFS62697.1 PA2778 family cysteine peptidase [Pseudodesulfovibrio thermohalotolerans]